jgi:hypothetical protein
MQVTKLFVGWMGILAAFASAILWFWAAGGVKVEAGDIGGFGGPTENTSAEFRKQAKLKAWAAVATGFSAVFQAISMWMS